MNASCAMPVPRPLGTDRDAIIQSVVAEYEIVAAAAATANAYRRCGDAA